MRSPTRRVCSICHKPGHRRSRCPEGEGKSEVEQLAEILRLIEEEGMKPKEVAELEGIPYPLLLAKLRKAGHYQGGKHTAPRKRTVIIPLSEGTYEALQALRREGFTSIAAAQDLRADLEEVNAAWATSSYRQYLTLRGIQDGRLDAANSRTMNHGRDGVTGKFIEA